MATATMRIDLETNAVKFSEDMKKARKSLDDIKDSLSLIKIDSIVNLSRTALSAAESFYNFGRNVASSLNNIERQAQMVGMTTSKFQEFAYVAKIADLEVGDFMTSMKFLANNMEAAQKGTGEAYETFQRLGLSVETSTGKLKPFDVMLMEIADKFSQYSDGADKAAALNNIFGRSGYSLTQFVNMGSRGISELIAKFKEYGFEISEDVIKRGSEAEEKFKNFEMAIVKLKTEITPLITLLTEVLTLLVKIATIKAPENMAATIGDIYSSQGLAQYALQSTSWAKFNTEEDLTKPVKAFPKGMDFDAIKSALNESKALYEEWREWWNSTWDAIWSKHPAYEPYTDKWIRDEDERIKKFYQETLPELETTFSKLLASVDMLSAEGKIPSWEDALFQPIKRAIPNVNALTLAFDQLLASVQKLSAEGKMPDWAEGLDPMTPGKGFFRKDGQLFNLKQFQDSAKEMQDFWVGVATNMGQALTSGFFNVFQDGIKGAGDAFKKFSENMLNTFTNVIQQLITNWLLFGNVMGMAGIGSGKGFGGLLGLIFPSFIKGGAGGSAGAPSPSGGSANYITILAVDSKSFVDMVERNPGAILKVVGSDARAAGSMRSAFRSYG